MEKKRLQSHPIINITPRKEVKFKFNGEEMSALEGETISSALFANGIKIFGHHPKDGSPQGIFCANGQCSQCLVLVNNQPLKACMTLVRKDMDVRSCEELPSLPQVKKNPVFKKINEIKTQVLIVGAGPAGLNAALELARLKVKGIIVDDKPELGGKLTLQTHAFFGSIKDCFAGTRGFRIGEKLAEELRKTGKFKIFSNTTAIGIFKDGYVGLLKENKYMLVKPDILLITCGAREKAISFPGCDLPGVYGAGAFQTLVNRDMIKASDKVFIVGGGNVGLIVGYHALQANIDVVGLVEALPEISGYKVHKDKLRRLGVPIWTRHTVRSANGKEKIESITIAEIDEKFKMIEGTEKSFEVDTILISIGLNPINELYEQARKFGMNVFSAGDAEEIAEASAAIFSGKLTGRKIAKELRKNVEIPEEWHKLAEILKSKPGKTTISDVKILEKENVMPVIRCYQEIPCNPCIDACPFNCITIRSGNIMDLPVYEGKCIGCGKCVAICPGLAINLVFLDYDEKKEKSMILVPYELDETMINIDDIVDTMDYEGNPVGKGVIKKIRKHQSMEKRLLVSIEVPYEERFKAASFRIRQDSRQLDNIVELVDDDMIVCRCERVTAREIREAIRSGVTDMNELKSILRTGMGACGGKTCESLIMQIFKSEGIDTSLVTPFTKRPLVAEVPLKAFAGDKK
ncbi:MAG: FAD-dependent oxidoreductase [Candidatus Coatesbacteria bacterium]|nr:FAD-dependent oxidoreductase [Candidatus Coatesbacteria bacterium]